MIGLKSARQAALTAAIVGAAGAAAAQPDTGKAEALDHPRLGESAPGFRLAGLAGETLDLAGFAGSYLVVHFGASW